MKYYLLLKKSECREFEDLRMELNILGNNASQNIRDVRNFLAGVNNSEEMRAIAASIESAAERDSPRKSAPIG